MYKNKLHDFIQSSLFLQNLLIQNRRKKICMKQFKNQKWQKTNNFSHGKVLKTILHIYTVYNVLVIPQSAAESL